MPELPEVETVMRGIAPHMVGQSLDRLVLNRPNLRFPIPQALPEQLKGERFQNFIRRGKYILGFTDSGAGFVLHLGMSGVIRIEHANDESKPQKHDHVVFELNNGTSIVFNDARRFGSLLAAHADSWQGDAPFNKMGPEPLSNDFSGPVLAEALKNKKTPIKTALLDQRVVSGVGNIYACEALYMSGIDPRRSANTVKGSDAENLSKAVKGVLVKAIEAGGSTLKDYRSADGDLGYFQHQFGVYGRAGFACPACDCDMMKGGVQKIVQSGRSSFFCPSKQK